MKICIDPGHAKETKGKRSPDGTLLEYEFNRDIAKRLKLLLEERNIEAIYSINIDEEKDTSTYKRASSANSEKVDLFISIHANAYGNGSSFNNASGIETYICVTGGRTEDVAKVVHRNVIESCRRKDRGVKMESFDVLAMTKMPAILLELGFYTNVEECELLKTDDYRKKCAIGIANGIFEYYNINKDSSINKLESLGIINSPEYWHERSTKDSNLKLLFDKIACYIEDK